MAEELPPTGLQLFFCLLRGPCTCVSGGRVSTTSRRDPKAARSHDLGLYESPDLVLPLAPFLPWCYQSG